MTLEDIQNLITNDNLQVENNINIMIKDKFEFISKVIRDKRFEYCINLKNIKQKLSQKLAEEYISHKYSEEHKRVLRVLLSQGSIKENQISELSILSVREVRSILMDLYRDNIVFKIESGQNL